MRLFKVKPRIVFTYQSHSNLTHIVLFGTWKTKQTESRRSAGPIYEGILPMATPGMPGQMFV